MIRNNKLYESITRDISKIIKTYLLNLNESKYDDVDHQHNNKFYRAGKRVTMHYNGLNYQAQYYSNDRKNKIHTAADISIKNNTNTAYKSPTNGIKLVFRKPTSKDNFCLQIVDNDINVFDDDNITHIAFMNELEKPNKFKVYILEKALIETVYDNLKNKINVRKSLQSKKLVDQDFNFLNNTKGKEGICLSNSFIRTNCIDSFLLKEM